MLLRHRVVESARELLGTREATGEVAVNLGVGRIIQAGGCGYGARGFTRDR